jgi:hypothetical protein
MPQKPHNSQWRLAIRAASAKAMYQSCFQSEGPGKAAVLKGLDTVSDVTSPNFRLGGRCAWPTPGVRNVAAPS